MYKYHIHKMLDRYFEKDLLEKYNTYDAPILQLGLRIQYFRILYQYLSIKYLIYKVVVRYKKIFE